jgi:sarcosine oxidase, subunit beta
VSELTPEPSTDADVIVVGAGIIGASCAYHLADAGLRVLVVDRNEAAAMGSTGLSAAGVRVQFVEPVNVALSFASILEYRRFETRFGVDPGYRPVGYLLLVPESGWADHLRGVEVQHAAGAPVEVLSCDEARRHVEFDPTGLAGATFGPFDGVVDPDSVTQAYLRAARERGAQVRFRCEVTAVERDGDGWVVRAGGAALRAPTLVNAAGCWAGALGRLAGLEVPVEPVRRMIYLTAPLAGRRTSPLVVDTATGTYFRTEGERILFGRSNPDEPPGLTVGMDWDWLEPTLEAATARFPWFADESLDPAASWYGYYEMTPDHNAVLGRHDQAPGWVDACGFSGHGVQQAPAVGVAIREEIVDGRSHTIDIDPLRGSRFATGERRSERHII